jgi:hypothetical protein
MCFAMTKLLWQWQPETQLFEKAGTVKQLPLYGPAMELMGPGRSMKHGSKSV